MNLTRLLVISILVPSTFVVAIILVSFIPHRAEVLTHGQEHLALAAVIVAGIVPFSFLMLRIFGRIQDHILRQNDELSRRATEMESLLKVGRAVEESRELSQVLPTALEAVLEATSAEAAEVWLLDRQEGALFMSYHHGVAREAFLEIVLLDLGEGYPGIVAQTGAPMLVP